MCQCCVPVLCASAVCSGRKLVQLRRAGNKILVQGGHFYLDVFIAYIVDNTGIVLAILHLW